MRGSRQNHHENRLDIGNERVQVFKERTDIQAEEMQEVKRLLESEVAKWTSAATARDQLESRMAGRELQQNEIERRGRGPADRRGRPLTRTNIALNRMRPRAVPFHLSERKSGSRKDKLAKVTYFWLT